MSLIPVTFDIQRDKPTLTASGGETQTTTTVYEGLSATFNYYPGAGRTAAGTQRFESTSQIRGPGLVTQTLGIVIFDPKPDGVTIQNDDRAIANPSVDGIPASLRVLAVRSYEVTLQLDVEALEP